MAKLAKRQALLHREACALVDVDRDLTEDEKDFVLDHWQESSTAANWRGVSPMSRSSPRPHRAHSAYARYSSDMA